MVSLRPWKTALKKVLVLIEPSMKQVRHRNLKVGSAECLWNKAKKSEAGVSLWGRRD